VEYPGNAGNARGVQMSEPEMAAFNIPMNTPTPTIYTAIMVAYGRGSKQLALDFLYAYFNN
jgi:hypothetical protein